MRQPRLLAAAVPRVRAWARKARVIAPRRSAKRREIVQLEQDLPVVLQRLAAHGAAPIVPPGFSRLGLTSLQRQLRDATESSAGVAQDDFLQQFRKHLHLLLDH